MPRRRAIDGCPGHLTHACAGHWRDASATRHSSRGGFSLLEMMVAMVVVGVLVAIAAPSYQRAIDQSRADIVAANLRAIWAAERLFWLENHTYTTDLANLQTLGLLDKTLPTNDPGAAPPAGKYWDVWYWYQVTPGTDPTASFTATANAATYAQNAGWTSNIAIDETGAISGTVSASNVTITPGFQ